MNEHDRTEKPRHMSAIHVLEYFFFEIRKKKKNNKKQNRTDKETK